MQIAPLGKGAFGAVSVVKWDNEFCALKQISKALVVKSQLVTHIKAEKRIMSECDSHFLVRMRASFQDSQHLYNPDPQQQMPSGRAAAGGFLSFCFPGRYTPCNEP